MYCPPADIELNTPVVFVDLREESSSAGASTKTGGGGGGKKPKWFAAGLKH